MVRRKTEAETLESVSDATVNAAESVRSDFQKLLEILDSQLEQLAQRPNSERLPISDARAAAERGLRLSERLVNLLGSSD